MFWEKSEYYIDSVALYARAWVEIIHVRRSGRQKNVALYARAWVEMLRGLLINLVKPVALYARAWVEICAPRDVYILRASPSTRGRG